MHIPVTLYVPKDSSPKEVDQATLVAKQLDPATQSNGSEDV